MRSLLYVAAFLACSGCLFAPRGATHVDDRAQMLDALTAQIPSGTSVAEAERIMLAEGFRENGRFEDAEFTEEIAWVGNPPPVVHTGIDYVCYDRTDADGLFMANCWTVAVVTTENVVVDVLVRHETEGP